MRWVRFQERNGGQIGHGALRGESIDVIAGDFFGERAFTGRRVALADARLLVPVIPATFYAAGVNYDTHIRSTSAAQGKPYVRPEPTDIVGYRAVNALIAHEEPIVIPRESSGTLQYEGELVAVIGRKTRYVSEADALSCVFGYSIGNDVSERTWQRKDRTLLRAKNTDTFKPMGPWIETDVDLESMVTRVRLNGREVSSFRTGNMICGVAEAISTISRNVTLHPGDIIWMGTDDPTLDMVAGDTVEIEISGIGVLRNPIVAEA